eukprot:g4207.t1
MQGTPSCTSFECLSGRTPYRQEDWSAARAQYCTTEVIAQQVSRDVCPATCLTWFDGCNDCRCELGEAKECTKKWCQTPSLPHCAEYDCTTRELYSPEKLAFCQALKTTTTTAVPEINTTTTTTAQPQCTGGRVWKDCGKTCTATCAEPNPTTCTTQCVPRCQCRDGEVWHAQDLGCVSPSACPSSQWPVTVGWKNSSTGAVYTHGKMMGVSSCDASTKLECVLHKSCSGSKYGSDYKRCPVGAEKVVGVFFKLVVRHCKCAMRDVECSGGRVWSTCASACDATCDDPRPNCAKGCFAKCMCPPGPGNKFPVWNGTSCVHSDTCPKPQTCTGGRVWNDGGSACTPTCLDPLPVCTQVMPRCECRSGEVWHGDKCVPLSACPSIAAPPTGACDCLTPEELPTAMKAYGSCTRHFAEDKTTWCYVGACGKARHYQAYKDGGSDYYIKSNCDMGNEEPTCPCLGNAYTNLGQLGTCGTHDSLDIGGAQDTGATHDALQRVLGSTSGDAGAEHWCYVGGCGKALGYPERVVKFSASIFDAASHNATLYVKRDCNIVTSSPTPVPPTPQPTRPPTPKPTPRPTHVIVPVSTRFQAAKGPYPSWGVGVSNRVISAGACRERCMAQPACEFGTYIPASGANVDAFAAGQCWLSGTGYSATDKLRECGVACIAFKKVPFTGKYQQDIKATPDPSEEEKLTVQRCRCSPKDHSSVLTYCFQDPHHEHLTRTHHINPVFHGVPLDGGESHRCKWYRDDPSQPHTFTWVMRDMSDALINGTNVTGGHMAARPPFIKSVEHVPSRKACMDLCETTEGCMYATFMMGMSNTARAFVDGEWVELTYHTCYLSATTYMASHPEYAPVCTGCDNFAKVKCQGCDKKGYSCKCCDCHGDGSPVSIEKIGFGAFIAKSDESGNWLADGSSNIKSTFAECSFQCAETEDCRYGTYLDGGECWLSQHGHEVNAGVCQSACFSFKKAYTVNGTYIGGRNRNSDARDAAVTELVAAVREQTTAIGAAAATANA